MSDLISRQAALAYPLSWEHYDKEHGDRKFICGVESYREYIEHLPSVDEWIPCSERLPRKNGKYLCCWQGASVGTGMFLDGHFRLYGEIKDNLVTAWMPLPEPYKGGEPDD